MLVWLEDCALNSAPVLGGDRFFNAILPIRLRIDFRIDQGFYRKRYRKRFRRGFETGKLETGKLKSVSSNWGDEARGQAELIPSLER